ncbi:MAG: EF-P lysine aminoacylase GenX [Deltaproteobacteria bacterium]|nr:EF-P lysine aminoacylase GenX [Deltaproteobacteria bacterium]
MSLKGVIKPKIIREYFDTQGFIEIDSPVLIKANAVEAYIDPIPVPGFGQLRTSPELYHKRLLAHGLEKIYELGAVFRDDPEGPLHSKEFTLLEWYRAGASLSDLIKDCEALFKRLDPKRFARPFEVKTMQELWLGIAQIDLREAIKQGDLVERVLKAGFALRDQADFSDAFHQVMLIAIEPKIGQEVPTVVTRWPLDMAALAQICKDDTCFAERFEIYYQGIELANAFLELTDPVEQRKRFDVEKKIRQKLGKDPGEIDEDFLSDLAKMPPAAGIALGFDRLLMCINDVKNIS